MHFSRHRLRGYRAARGWSRDRTAVEADCEITGSIIKNYESGFTVPRLHVVDALARAFEVTRDDLAPKRVNGTADYVAAAMETVKTLSESEIETAALVLDHLRGYDGYRRTEPGVIKA